MDRADAFLRYGSGWTFEDVKSVDIHTCAYNMVGGTSYIPTPSRFKNNSIINVQNKDERCFAYSVLAGIFPAKSNVSHPSSYEKYMDTLNFEGIDFPVKPTEKQMSTFEAQNPQISLNVQHVAENGRIIPLYATELRGRKHPLNLLLQNESVSVDPEGIESIWERESELPEDHVVINRFHYTLVKNLSVLVRSRTNHNEK